MVRYISIVTLLLLITASCVDRGALRALDSVESYITEEPDRALSALDSLSQAGIKGKEANARYALLYSMALDKSGIDTADISIIENAVRYYGKKGDDLRKAQSYYYLARVYQNGKDYDHALSAISNAKTFADKVGVPYLKGLISDCKGRIYELSGEFDNALLLYSDAVDHFRSAGSDKNIMYLYGAMGNVYAKQGNNSKSLECAYKSMDIAKALKDTAMTASALQRIATVHLLEGDYLKALEITRTVTSEYYEGEIPTALYPLVCQICLSSGEVDKARHYAEALLDSSHDTQSPGIYALLAKIEALSGNYRKSNDYLRRYLHIQDSLGKYSQHRSVYETDMKYRNKELLRVISEKDRHFKAAIITAGLVFLLLATFAGLLFLFRKHQIMEKDREIRDYQERLDTIRKYCGVLEAMKKSQPAKDTLIEHQMVALNTLMEILLKADPQLPSSLSVRFHNRGNSVEPRSKEMLGIFNDIFDIRYPGARELIRDKYPDLSAKDSDILFLLCIDCPVSVISYSVGSSPSYIYNRKSALRQKLDICGRMQTFSFWLEEFMKISQN